MKVDRSEGRPRATVTKTAINHLEHAPGGSPYAPSVPAAGSAIGTPQRPVCLAAGALAVGRRNFSAYSPGPAVDPRRGPDAAVHHWTRTRPTPDRIHAGQGLFHR